MASKLLFLALVGFLAVAGPGCAAQETQADRLVAAQVLSDPYAYDFPRLGATGASLFPMRLCNGFKLEEASIDDIQEQLAGGNLTSVELLQCYLERIYQTDSYLKYTHHLSSLLGAP